MLGEIWAHRLFFIGRRLRHYTIFQPWCRMLIDHLAGIPWVLLPLKTNRSADYIRVRVLTAAIVLAATKPPCSNAYSAWILIKFWLLYLAGVFSNIFQSEKSEISWHLTLVYYAVHLPPIQQLLWIISEFSHHVKLWNSFRNEHVCCCFAVPLTYRQPQVNRVFAIDQSNVMDTFSTSARHEHFE